MLLKRGLCAKLKIDDLSSSGLGVGHLEGCAVFVPLAVPGDEVQIKITDLKKNLAQAILLEIIRPSPQRQPPLCPVFGQCGGCQLQHLSYSFQLASKQKRLSESLRRLGGLECPVDPIIGMPNPWRYRNKLSFKVGRKQEVGFYQKQSKTVVATSDCLLAASRLTSVAAKAGEHLASCHPQSIQVRQGSSNSELLLNIQLKDLPLNPKKIFEDLKKSFPELTGISLSYAKGSSQNEEILGKNSLMLKLKDINFQVSSSSFFQVNTWQAENLYSKALEMAQPALNDVVFDAFCGVGGFALFFARYVRLVYGVESEPLALADAMANAELNALRNVKFIKCNLEEPDTAFKQLLRQTTLLVVDPPRRGLSLSFLRALKEASQLTKIVYASCDPATLSRDLKALSLAGFGLKKLVPLDMFPQTCHLETLALLKNK